jgi:hypothetical protein
VQIQQEQNRRTLFAQLGTDWHYQSAAEHVSAFPARLALARWMQGGDIPHVYSSTHQAPARAAWYAQAQRDFQAWLENGGFHGE